MLCASGMVSIQKVKDHNKEDDCREFDCLKRPNSFMAFLKTINEEIKYVINGNQENESKIQTVWFS